MPYRPDGDDDSAVSPLLRAARSQAERQLLGIPGVTGVGAGRTPLGDEAVVVYVRTAADCKRLPPAIAGVPLVCEVTGEIEAL